VLLPEYPIADTGIHAVMPQRRLVPPRVRAFVDFMAEQLGDPPPWEQRLVAHADHVPALPSPGRRRRACKRRATLRVTRRWSNKKL
jgi:hypothetical protein